MNPKDKKIDPWIIGSLFVFLLVVLIGTWLNIKDIKLPEVWPWKDLCVHDLEGAIWYPLLYIVPFFLMIIGLVRVRLTQCTKDLGLGLNTLYLALLTAGLAGSVKTLFFVLTVFVLVILQLFWRAHTK